MFGDKTNNFQTSITLRNFFLPKIFQIIDSFQMEKIISEKYSNKIYCHNPFRFFSKNGFFLYLKLRWQMFMEAVIIHSVNSFGRQMVDDDDDDAEWVDDENWII